MYDWRTLTLVLSVLAVLGIATAVGQFFKRNPDSGLSAAALQSFNSRLWAWWLMCAVLATAYWVNTAATVVLFGLISFWALREFITLTPTRMGDHRALFWVFFLFTPLQYLLVGMNEPQMFNVLIPVYAFLFIMTRVALSGDYKRFLERTAKIHVGLVICVFCLSFAPALLNLEIPGHENANFRLLFFLILVVQVVDALQYWWDTQFGKHLIAPTINASKTWEGLAGSLATVALLGAALSWATPFQPWLAALMALLVGVMGFAGRMTMSAIKRDRGVKDYGTLVEGHGGLLDRIDSICFAAPVFYHVTTAIFPQ